MTSLRAITPFRAIAAALLFAASIRAESFLPMPAQPMHFVGTHWSEDSKDRPLKATATLHEMGKGGFGTAVELRIVASDAKRKIEPMQWLITPDGAVYDVWFGEANAELQSWLSGKSKPGLTLSDLRLPACDPESGEFTKPQDPAVSSSGESWLWSQAPTSFSIRLNPARDMARYASLHEGNSNFSTLVFQRGTGLVRLARGSGAHRDGWQFDRIFTPAAKLSAAPDVAQLFAALPHEAMPGLGALSMLAEPEARQRLMADAAHPPRGIRDVKLDRKSGALSIGSDTDGEGDVLEAALWKRPDGARLIALHVKHWTAGPEATSDVRLFEFAGGEFRVATFTSLPLPEPRDFFTRPDDQPNTGPFITGDWKLPARGTTIFIRPELEDDEDMLGDVKCLADQAFELRWKNGKFERISLPRTASKKKP